MYWRSFAPAWLFPLVFLYGGVVSQRLGHPVLFFWFIAMPLFFFTSFRASRPWVERKIRYGHYVLLAIVLPFLIWIAAVFSHKAVAYVV